MGHKYSKEIKINQEGAYQLTSKFKEATPEPRKSIQVYEKDSV